MNQLYNKLKNHTIQDAIKIEETDRQFVALKNMVEEFDGISCLSFVLANSIICYQLSSTGENYWEEFSDKIIELSPSEIKKGVGDFFKDFLPNSKGNKRFIDTKIKRLEKLRPFLEKFVGREEYYYDNMIELRDELGKAMKQKNDAKTIVFSVKMFNYAARLYFDKIVYFPNDISIPVDSRITNLFEKYKGDYTDIKKFYFDLSKKLNIPELHLDAIVWVNYDELIK